MLLLNPLGWNRGTRREKDRKCLPMWHSCNLTLVPSESGSIQKLILLLRVFYVCVWSVGGVEGPGGGGDLLGISYLHFPETHRDRSWLTSHLLFPAQFWHASQYSKESTYHFRRCSWFFMYDLSIQVQLSSSWFSCASHLAPKLWKSWPLLVQLALLVLGVSLSACSRSRPFTLISLGQASLLP